MKLGEYFVIRQKSTGKLMPRANRGNGNTWSSFDSGNIPRLFSRKQDAVSALAWWLEGGFVNKDRYDPEGDFNLVCRPQPNRNKDDIEIVSVALVTTKAS